MLLLGPNYPFKRQPDKMVKDTQTIRQLSFASVFEHLVGLALKGLIKNTIPKFISAIMTFYPNYHRVLKLKSVYEKSLPHLACEAVLLKIFLSTLERSGNWLGWFFHWNIYIFLVYHRSYLLEKKSNSNWSFRRSSNCILTVKENKILLSGPKWLNDNIMDATEKLINKAIGRIESNQSVLNWQNNGTPFYEY